MRTALLFSLVGLCAAGVFAQTAQPQTPGGAGGQPAATKPASPPPAGRGAATPATGRGNLTLTVTNPIGGTLPHIHVVLSGPTPRMGDTDESGMINFTGLQAGTYRLLFTGDAVTAFEREVAVTAKPMSLDIPLSPAPPPKEVIKLVAVPEPAPPPPTPAAPVTGPIGRPQIVSLVDLAMKELDRKQPRRESLVACSGTTRSTLLQLNSEQPARLYEQAESVIYVIAGEGLVRINDQETQLSAGGFAAIPRATSFVLARRGRNPLIVLSVLSGEPCEEAK